jgi:hypothetical protein
MKIEWISRIGMVALAVLFVGTSWAGGPNAGLIKSNSLTVENDPTTSSWTSTCDISVSGVDVNQIYSGRMLFQFLPSFGGPTVTVFDAFFQVDPANRTWTESIPGIYTVKAKLKGHDVTAHAEYKFNTITPGDRFLCGSRIDQGPISSATTTLFGSNMDNTVAQP